jgi:GNAT superfamily N-acetyltransferase
MRDQSPPGTGQPAADQRVASPYVQAVSVIEGLEQLPPLDVVSVELADGTTVEMRSIEAGDAAGLLRFHGTLSTETTYLRFFCVHPQLSKYELERFTRVDHRDREAIVATIDDDIVGVARFDRLDNQQDAEVAFVVTDCWQGHGLGNAMFRELAHRARRAGVARFVADTLPQNSKMLGVFHDAGLPMTSKLRDGVVHLVIHLEEGHGR